MFFFLSFSRIDVNKNESSNGQERMIVIRGETDNCIKACHEILRIMHDDTKMKNRTKLVILNFHFTLLFI